MQDFEGVGFGGYFVFKCFYLRANVDNGEEAHLAVKYFNPR